MRRSTAVRRLAEMADVAADRLRLRDSDLGWPLEELWVTDDLLEHRSELEAGSVVLVLDLAPDELPWLASHPVAEWVGTELRLGKRPFLWSYRPALWPVWNRRHRRVARFWSTRSGIESAVLDALGAGRVEEAPVVEPSTDELVDPDGGLGSLEGVGAGVDPKPVQVLRHARRRLGVQLEGLDVALVLPGPHEEDRMGSDHSSRFTSGGWKFRGSFAWRPLSSVSRSRCYFLGWGGGTDRPRPGPPAKTEDAVVVIRSGLSRGRPRAPDQERHFLLASSRLRQSSRRSAEGHREASIEDPRRSDSEDGRGFRRGRTEGHRPSKVCRSSSAAAGPWAVGRPDIVLDTPMGGCWPAALLVKRWSFEPGDAEPLLPDLQ